MIPVNTRSYPLLWQAKPWVFRWKELATALTVKKLPRLIKRGMYLDRDGLYLQAKSPDSRSWVLRFERHGKKRWMGLGSLATFSLEEARQRARKARQMLADGIDPLLARREQQAKQAAADARSKDFRTVCSEYFNAHGDAWVARHRVNFIDSLKNHAYPIIGSLPIAAVDVALVLKVLQPIWKEKIRTAQALQRRMASVFDFAIAAGYVSDNNLQHLVPAADRLARVQHHPALPFAEIAGFVSELLNVDGVAARALEFLILTAARSDEVIGARWDEIKFDEAQWVVPAARMKNKREHRVPLSAQAIRLLRSLPREEGNGFVFIGRKAAVPWVKTHC